MLNKLHFGSAVGLALLLNLLSGDFWKGVQAETANDKSKIVLPSRRVGGGTRRDSCVSSNGSLVALVPENSLGTTTSAFPTFFFYLPEIEQSQTIEFVVRDQEDRLVYDTTFSTTDSSGIISLSLPSTELEPLQVDNDYHWYLSIICNPQNRAQDIVVEGLIRRIELQPSLVHKLNNLEPLERVNFYQQANIWYEAIATVAQSEAFRSHETAMMAKWLELLHSVGLEAIAQEPLVETYNSSAPMMTNFELGTSNFRTEVAQ